MSFGFQIQYLIFLSHNIRFSFFLCCQTAFCKDFLQNKEKGVRDRLWYRILGMHIHIIVITYGEGLFENDNFGVDNPLNHCLSYNIILLYYGKSYQRDENNCCSTRQWCEKAFIQIKGFLMDFFACLNIISNINCKDMMNRYNTSDDDDVL